MRRLVWLLGVLLLAGSPASAWAQDPALSAPTARADSVTEIRLRDGSVLVGRVESESETQVTLVTASGARVEIPRAQIVSMRRAMLRADGQVWPDDDNVSRLFFSSTGRPLPKGTGYVSAYWLFFPFVAYGVTDRFTLAGGTPIVPPFTGRTFYLAPKFALHNEGKLSVSLGALSFFVTEQVDDGNLGILYGVGTYGTGDNAVTLGAGWFYAATDDEFGTSDEPALMLGYESRLSRRVKFITENWLAVNPGVSGLLSGGFRFIGDRLSADLGLVGATGGEVGCCFPTVNFVWSFGKAKR